MILHIPQVLSADRVAQCRAALADADWRGGGMTAGPQSRQVKDNDQVHGQCPVGSAQGDMILAALEQNPTFISAALPHRVFPPLFNRYREGMGFGLHIDNALRPLPGSAARLRTDLSATLFLTNPDSYDGGELVIEEGDVTHQLKLPAGDMILYPADTLHSVATVTRGERLASFFWVQSLIADRSAREMLYDLDSAIRSLTGPDSPIADNSRPVLQLTRLYHQLVRRWAAP